MKQQLIKNLEAAYKSVVEDTAAVNYEHTHSYRHNYTVSVPYQHNMRVSIGKWLRSKWVWKTVIRYRDEIRFDFNAFHRDLNNANKKLQESKNKLNQTQQLVQSEVNKLNQTLSYKKSFCDDLSKNIDYLKNSINSLTSNNSNLKNNIYSVNRNNNSLKNELNSLQNKVNYLKSKLSIYGTNLSNTVAQYTNQKNGLEQQKTSLENHSYHLQNQIGNLRSEITTREYTHEQLKNNLAQMQNRKKTTYDKLCETVLSYDECQKTKLVVNAKITNNKTLLKLLNNLSILQNCDYWVELAAYIAMQKNKIQVFEYFINQKADFDSIISQQETLALSIIKSGNQNYINKLFAAKQELVYSAFMACSDNDFTSLKTLITYDQNILKKIQNIESLGFGVIQHAISHANIELIEFVAKHDISCFKQKIIGYENSYLKMAVLYNNPQVITTIGKYINFTEEVIQFVKNNQYNIFEKVITKLDLSKDQLVKILKECIANDQDEMSRQVLKKIPDVKQLFIETIESRDSEFASNLYELAGEQISEDFLNKLIREHQNDIENELWQHLDELTMEIDENEIANLLSGEEGRIDEALYII